MSSISENRHTNGGLLLATVFLCLLTLADSILSNSLPIALGSASPQTPGFWNLTTTALILSAASDLIGQVFLNILTCRYSSEYAMNFNSFSILIASIYSLVSSFQATEGLAWIPAIASIFKIIGGGSHATAFLTLTLIREKTSGTLCAALIYTTGATIVLCQTIASVVTPSLAIQSPILPYIISILCCVLAIVVTIIYNKAGGSASDPDWADNSSAQPLLPNGAAVENATSPRALAGMMGCSGGWHNKPSMTKEVLKSIGFIFFIAAIAKATRPLFITYIQHRVGIIPKLANYLWLVRTVMSLVIFAVVLPLVVILLPRCTSRLPSTITLSAAKISVVLLAIGALLIGVAQSEPVLISGLLINTLGVATDLSLLAYATDAITEDMASYFFLTIASLESAGTLIGIGLLYPLYQLCLDNDTLFGGIPYYICAGLFAIAGVRVWSTKPFDA
ncbi:hypothetical protein HD806DRAFT_527656 [Xylariaceae sp. AK1471]|nr:hypothetical protein HD806DRAFT_527656 [Xylariaceae sp. AK1471]